MRTPKPGDVVKLVPQVEQGWWAGGPRHKNWIDWRPMVNAIAGTVLSVSESSAIVLTMDQWKPYSFRLKDLEVVDEAEAEAG